MDLLEKNIELNKIYDLYQELLTSKQQSYFEAYYFDDLSISEISENYEISRNAVHDQLKRTVTKLNDLEQKLKLREMKKTRKSLYDKIVSKTDNQEIIDLVEDCKKVE